jgi:N-acetylmuramoyl-L-alanine amidase
MRQTVRHSAATIRPALRILLGCLGLVSLCCVPGRAERAAARRDSAKIQFNRAESQRQALEARPEKDRSLKEYSALVAAYRRVYLITPRSAEVPAALNQAAILYRAMGDLFDTKYYQMAIDSYLFLLREYPASRYREDALLAVAQIEREDLHDPVRSQQSHEEFLRQHPHSRRAAEVRAALRQMNQQGAAEKAAPNSSGAKTSTATKSDAPAKAQQPQAAQQAATAGLPAPDGSEPVVTRIRTWNADTYTRTVIDISGKALYQAARITDPDRIYFDIENAKIDPALLHQPVPVASGGYLKTVRIAQNQLDVVRIVLEVNHAKDYSVFLLPNPYRLVVDVYGTSAAAEAAARATSPPPGPTTDLPLAQPEQPGKETVGKTPAKAGEKSDAVSAAVTPTKPAAPPQEKASASRGSSSPPTGHTKAPGATATAKASSRSGPNPATDSSSRPDGAKGEPPPASATVSAENRVRPDAAPSIPSSAPSSKSVRNTTKTAHEQAEEMGPAPVPDPTRDGQHSLTRALGLKIGRIVIDPGHGGHDTGTIGPTGLMEKDLCLDVALRVGKLIQQRLASAEVVYTRDDDTFVPLEQRTSIANEARADLFLSIHANSSRDKRARGVETYYLNFTGSSDAMEVATRENALSGNSVHDLQDLVSKIARNEKIEESRDFATDIQESLAKRMEGINRGGRNRGIRKAPFVVLIGANMPSVLAEISFISNPGDETWLKKPENRQRVADGLYRGIESYLHSTNSLTYNQNYANPGNRSGILARSGNPQ